MRQPHFCGLIWVVVVTTGCGGRSDHTGQQDHLPAVTPVADAAPNQPQSAETSPVTGTPTQLALPNQAGNTNEHRSSAVTADGDNEGIQKARAAGVPTSFVHMGDAPILNLSGGGTNSSPAFDMGPHDHRNEGHGAPITSHFEGMVGALVTSDCTYRGYAYAVDILLSCGNERFDSPLRLHTFKRHSLSHTQIFNDQRLSVRDGRLWFEAYEPPRCILVDEQGQLGLSTRSQACGRWHFLPHAGGFRLQHQTTAQCVGLGSTPCTAHRWTGGVECGGIEHRYLPLAMGACTDGLTFQRQSRVLACVNEYPDAACF